MDSTIVGYAVRGKDNDDEARREHEEENDCYRDDAAF